MKSAPASPAPQPPAQAPPCPACVARVPPGLALGVALCFSAAALALFLVAALINTAAPLAYMDEIFHVPMAIARCLASDSRTLPPPLDLLLQAAAGAANAASEKITTPPGLYIITCLFMPPKPPVAVHVTSNADDAVLTGQENAHGRSNPQNHGFHTRESDLYQQHMVATLPWLRAFTLAVAIALLLPCLVLLSTRVFSQNGWSLNSETTRPASSAGSQLEKTSNRDGRTQDCLSDDEIEQESTSSDTDPTDSDALVDKNTEESLAIVESEEQSKTFDASWRGRFLFPLWNALNAWLCPPAFMYYFFFYTDALSLALVMACYVLSRLVLHADAKSIHAQRTRKGGCKLPPLLSSEFLGTLALRIFAAGLGAVACFVRQTNIAWLFFCAGASLLDFAGPFRTNLAGAARNSAHAQPGAASLSSPTSTQSQGEKNRALPERETSRAFLPSYSLTVGEHQEYVKAVLSRRALVLLSPYAAAVGILGHYAARYGIVQGDVDNHRMAFHVPQLYYLAAAQLFFNWPVLLSLQVAGALVVVLLRLARSYRGIMVALVIASIMCASTKLLTYEHPFLLADNRHYMFYVWRRLFRSSSPAGLSAWRHAYVPIYAGAMWIALRKLSRSQASSVFVTLFAVASALALVPSPLVEVRYFIIPLVLFRAHIRVSNVPRLAAESVWLVIINVAVTMVFIYKPFVWPGGEAVAQGTGSGHQRFIW